MIQHNVSIQTTITRQEGAMDQETETLLNEARAAAKRAYAPYSKFRVGAAVLLDNGEIISGNNQENAAYPSGLCAERTTVFYANSRYPEAKVLHLMIYAETDAGPVESPVTPCGACRQVLLEKEAQQGQPIRVSLAGAKDVYHLPSVGGALLPLAFDKL